MRRGCALMVVLMAAGFAGSAFGQVSELYGEIVGTVDLFSESAIDEPALRPLISVEPGQPLSLTEVQSSIKTLFGTGRFRDIRVDARPSGAGVDVTFRMTLHYFVGDIRWEIEGADTDVRPRRESKLESGKVFSLSAVDRNAVAVQRAYVREGYLEAVVDPAVAFSRENDRADVTFYVVPGPRATVSAITFDGDTGPFAPAELEGKMDSRVGAAYEVDRARSDADRIEDFLARENFRRADVRFAEGVYDDESASVRLLYEVQIGPKVRVEVEGVDEDDVRRIVRFSGTERYTVDKVGRTVDDLVERYQRRGYYFVDVDTREGTVDGDYVITYTIDPGQSYELEDVRFSGNETFSNSELRDVVATAPPGVFTELLAAIIRRRTGITTRELQDDRDALEAFYLLEGFTTVEVRRPVVEPINETSIAVTFPIVEGPRSIVTAVEVIGIEQREGDLPDLLVEPGEPLNPQSVGLDIVSIRSAYGDEGFAEIRVEPVIEFSDDRTEAIVRYELTEGPQTFIGKVAVRGNTYTKESVILRKARLEEGAPFTWRALLEAQQRLYRLGIFSIVEILPNPSPSAAQIRDISIQVREGNVLTVSGSVGYSTEDQARGSAAVSHRNLFGTGRYLGLDGTVSQRVDRFVLTYREPFLFGYDIPTQANLYSRDEERADGAARISTFGASVELTRVLAEQFRWGLRYEYRLNDCVSGELCDLATSGFPIEGIDPEDQEIQISSITPSAFWDRRDDPVNPSNGFYAGLSIEYAFPMLRAETEFLKGFLQGAGYWSVTERTQFVFAGRFGMTEPLGDVELARTVPFAERFLAGGERTHRGFELDRLGIPCQTLIPDPADVPEGQSCQEYVETAEDVRLIPIGGNALAIINVEYRYPIFGSLHGAVFVDGGNVWREIEDIDTSEIRWGAGLGARYLTPVGPVRLDVGFNLDPAPYEDRYEIFLTLGYAF
ncbi:MAG: outer membrane protein assembly factor BamA [Acidobacteria bacterium]|nr:outer membrane protein assembly factor BamA [Acidobacteriota bacterium]